MENRSNTPGKVLKALISKYIYSLEDEEKQVETYFDSVNSSPNCKVRGNTAEDNDLSCA